MQHAVTIALAIAAVLPMVQSYTNPITAKGYKMFDAKTGNAFAVKGIDYYPRPNAGVLNENNVDFFTDDFEKIWRPDIEYLAKSGANVVRVYAVDPSQSHDLFMCALRARGMYALVDLGASCENCSITIDEYPACYPSALKSRGEQIISEFAQYDNVLAFSVGNEVNNIVDNAWTNAPCQKKFLRDMRAFLGECSSFRDILVGAVLADPNTKSNNREVNSKYYNCRTDPSDEYENAQWYGLNTYQYCDSKLTELAISGGFQKLLTDFSSFDLTIPVLLTEFGCLNPSFPTIDGYEAQHKSPYPFTKYGPQNYGTGYYSPEDCDHKTVPCVFNPMPNFFNLAKQFNATDVSGEPKMDDFTPKRTKLPSCPDKFPALADVKWEADSVASLTCPSTVQQFKCPAQSPSAFVKKPKATDTTGGTAPGTGNGSTSLASSFMTRPILLAGMVAAFATLFG
ncbi:unnamed protein product [Peronospora destructor]|uniref:1,3-beta-glucanosyltransferase n=1 Tax=Peronospora destructor TaxID=86335 RepID=A0AAV0U1L3_9STRA|nr:unnamed protein product [Peronospora destructor]